MPAPWLDELMISSFLVSLFIYVAISFANIAKKINYASKNSNLIMTEENSGKMTIFECCKTDSYGQERNQDRLRGVCVRGGDVPGGSRLVPGGGGSP